MPKHNRNTLKSFFSDGAMPSSDMFEDLIDSTINLNDDGFEKTDVDGIKISNIGDYNHLISLYDQKNRNQAEWQFRLDGVDNSLVLGSPVAVRQHSGLADSDVIEKNKLANALCFDHSNGALKVGIGTKTPKTSLDVNGTLMAKGRRGSFGESFKTVDADGEWKSITPALKGGIALEVVARAMNMEKKYYGLMHAVALHSPWRARRDLSYFLGLKNKIRYTHGFYDSMLHKLRLRWKRLAGEDGYRLQIRSNCKYGDAGKLDFHITCLWSDDDEFQQVLADSAGESV